MVGNLYSSERIEIQMDERALRKVSAWGNEFQLVYLHDIILGRCYHSGVLIN